MNWKEHKEKWSSCEACPLCEKRNKVVLCRGSLPCDVLFIGEAPGQSEDSIGQPFVGPAGHLLDEMIAKAIGVTLLDENGDEVTHINKRLAFTNLVACIPIEAEGTKKMAEPSQEAIQACQPRLDELVAMAKPKLIVMVGKLSEKWVPKSFGYGDARVFVGIIHPAAILRADPAQQGLLIQRCIVTLADSIENL